MRAALDHHQHLIFICTCQCIASLGLMAMVPIMPLYLDTLGNGYAPFWSSIALAAPAVTGIIFSKRIGIACDHYGYRIMVIASITGFSLSMLFMALSTSMPGFLLGRLLLGASSLNLTLTAFSCAASLESQRGRSLGLLQSAAALGCLIGPVVGGIMLDFGSLSFLLLAIAIFSGVAALLAFFTLEDPKQLVPQIMLQQPAKKKLAGPAEKDPAVKYWAMAACLSQAAAFALVNVFVLFLDTLALDLPLATTAGVIHAGAWAATLLSSPWWGSANDRRSPRRNFLIAALGCAFCIGILPLINSVWLIIILRFAQGACFSALAQTVLYSLSQGKHRAFPGTGVGLAKQYLLAGQILGPGMVAILIPWVSATGILYWVSGCFLLSALTAWRVTEQQIKKNNRKIFSESL